MSPAPAAGNLRATYRSRRVFLTRTEFLSDRAKRSLDRLWATDDDYVALQVTRLFYQGLIGAYCDADRRRGKKLMQRVIDTLRRGVPAGLEELAQLGRTLRRRHHDILA